MVKKFSQLINEKNEMYGNDILNFLKNFTKITDGYQKQYYEMMVSDAKIVKCTSMYDIFTSEEIENIKRLVKPKVKECYKNSYMLQMNCGIPDTMYCEGYTSYMGIPIEHAFNKVGDKYIDITSELILKKDVTDDEYVLLGEFTKEDVYKVTNETGYYGGVYNKLLLDKIKNK